MDLEIAYDNVNREKLCKVLEKYDIKGKMVCVPWQQMKDGLQNYTWKEREGNEKTAGNQTRASNLQIYS